MWLTLITFFVLHRFQHSGLIGALSPSPECIVMKRRSPYSPLINHYLTGSTYNRNQYHKKNSLHTTVPIPPHPNLLRTTHRKPLHIYLEVLQTLVIRLIPPSSLYLSANRWLNGTPPPSLIFLTNHCLYEKIHYNDDCKDLPWSCNFETMEEQRFASHW